MNTQVQFKPKKKRRVGAKITAAVLALVIVLGGTFAWSAISNMAANLDRINNFIGGRLHDDFTGITDHTRTANIDIYAENFGVVPLVVRVQLREFMEWGNNAGLTHDNTYQSLDVEDGRQVTQFVPSADILDRSTWTVRVPNPTNVNQAREGTPAFHSMVTWDLGGQKVFMPTFNRDNTCLATNVTGLAICVITGVNTRTDFAINGVDATTPKSGAHDQWTIGDTKTAIIDYGVGDSRSNEEVTIAARNTLNATIMTTTQWYEADMPSGEFWIWDDVDGWAYWGQLLLPGQATGLLLDEYQIITDNGPDLFYGVHANAEFAAIGRADMLTDRSERGQQVLDMLEDEEVSAPDTSDLADLIATATLGTEFTVITEDGSSVDWVIAGEYDNQRLLLTQDYWTGYTFEHWMDSGYNGKIWSPGMVLSQELMSIVYSDYQGYVFMPYYDTLARFIPEGEDRILTNSTDEPIEWFLRGGSPGSASTIGIWGWRGETCPNSNYDVALRMATIVLIP